jgi:nifR3 family TIM-barrel protein
MLTTVNLIEKNSMASFWSRLKRPVFVLAPMADVTDAAFRRIIAKYGKPDVTWTEFVSADGLCSIGRDKLLPDLSYSEEERPIVAQLFSSNPEKMEEAARLVASLGYDGIDINMGCPDKAIERQGCGSAMIKNPAVAAEIIRAAKRGAPNLPISVKTRLGYNKDELETWLPHLLKEKPAAVTIHARTRKDMSKVPARWERVKRAVEIRDEVFGIKDEADRVRVDGDTIPFILGNGDVIDLEDAKKKAAETGADGVMIGRAVFGNPWVFSKDPATARFAPFWESGNPNRAPLSREEIETRLRVGAEHANLFAEVLAHKGFHIMRKHFKAYCAGFRGARELRGRLMEAETVAELTRLIEEFLASPALDEAVAVEQ